MTQKRCTGCGDTFETHGPGNFKYCSKCKEARAQGRTRRLPQKLQKAIEEPREAPVQGLSLDDDPTLYPESSKDTACWPERLETIEEEQELLYKGPWKKAMPYFFAVDHRDKVGMSAPLYLSSLQQELATEIDKALACEIAYLDSVSKDGGKVYIQDFRKRLGNLSPTQAVRQGVFSPFEIGIRVNVLKSRRGGSSTFFLCAALRACVSMDSYSAISWAETTDSMQRIFRLQRFAADRWPEDIFLNREVIGIERTANTQQKFANNSSHIARTVGTSTRGDKFDFLHLTEYAHYQSMDDVQQSMLVARPHTWICKESTANGRNHFYEDWNRGRTPSFVMTARRNKDFDSLRGWNGEYNIFFPWWRDPGLTLPCTKEEKVAILENLDEYEQRLMAFTEGRLSPSAIKFRREAILKTTQGDLEGLSPEQFFDQEYPWSAESAFQVASKVVFDASILEPQRANIANKKVYLHIPPDKPVEVVRSSPVCVYAPPDKDLAYVISADISFGVGWDYSEAGIFCRHDGTKFEEVANIRSNTLSPSVFAWFVSTMAYVYNDAFIIGESMGGGVSFNDSIFSRLDYGNIYFRHSGENLEQQHQVHSSNPKLGVWFSSKLKSAAIDRLTWRLKQSIDDDSLILRSEHGLQQLFRYQFDGKKFRAPKGQYDDYVSMLLLLMMAADHLPPMENQIDSVKRQKSFPSLWSKIEKADEVVWNQILKQADRIAKRNQRGGNLFGVPVPMERTWRRS